MRTQVNNKTFVITLTNILYAPTMRNNLLSIGKLNEAGGRAITSGGKIQLLNWDGQIFAEGRKLHAMYYLSAISNMAHTTENRQTWHKKLGHVSLEGLKNLLHKDLVDGFNVDKQSPEFECNACIQAKHSRAPFPKEAESRAERPGELTHTDVWGPACIEGRYRRSKILYFLHRQLH